MTSKPRCPPQREPAWRCCCAVAPARSRYDGEAGPAASRSRGRRARSQFSGHCRDAAKPGGSSQQTEGGAHKRRATRGAAQAAASGAARRFAQLIRRDVVGRAEQAGAVIYSDLQPHRRPPRRRSSFNSGCTLRTTPAGQRVRRSHALHVYCLPNTGLMPTGFIISARCRHRRRHRRPALRDRPRGDPSAAAARGSVAWGKSGG